MYVNDCVFLSETSYLLESNLIFTVSIHSFTRTSLAVFFQVQTNQVEEEVKKEQGKNRRIEKKW
jgi:hypothetical protein